MLQFGFKLAKCCNGIDLLDFATDNEPDLAGIGFFRSAGQLAYCYHHLPVRLVAMGGRLVQHYFPGGNNLSGIIG